MIFNLNEVKQEQLGSLVEFLPLFTKDGLRLFYNAIKSKIEFYYNDIQATEETLSDTKLNFLDRVEYKNDITADKMQISLLNSYLEVIVNYALNNNIVLEEEEKIDKPKVLSKTENN